MKRIILLSIFLLPLTGQAMRIFKKSINWQLLEAIQKEDLPTIELLVTTKHANVNAYFPNIGTPLIIAIRKLHRPLLKKLLELGADPNLNNPLQHLIERRYSFSAKQIKNEGDLKDARRLIESERLSLALLLLSSGADPNGVVGDPLLNKAINLNSEKIVAALLEAGADPNAVDWKDETPLLIAINTGSSDPKIIELLLDYGADPLYKDANKRNALMWFKQKPANVQEQLRKYFEGLQKKKLE